MPMSTALLTRLKALALAATFVVGGGSAAAADMLRHHLDLVKHFDGRHVEPPGTCLDHQHQCDLGLSVAGPKLAFPQRDQLPPDQESPLSLKPVQLTVPVLHSLLRLPDSRAPPHLG